MINEKLDSRPLSIDQTIAATPNRIMKRSIRHGLPFVQANNSIILPPPHEATTIVDGFQWWSDATASEFRASSPIS
jgi:hypothetical protein